MNADFRQSGYMEEEIDLREYVEVLLKYKFWIIGLAVLAAGVAFVIASLQPPTYQAQASLALLRVRSDVTLEPKFETQADIDSSTKSRQQTMVVLAKNSYVAEAVSEQLEGRMNGVKINVTTEIEGDLLLIKVRSGDRQLAAEVANAWAQQAELFINSIYGQSSRAAVEIQAREMDAQTQYEAAQKALEDFVAENRVRSLEGRIGELEQVNTRLREQQVAAIDLYLGKQIEIVETQANDYFDALLEQRQTVFDEQQKEKLELLRYYYSRKQNMERLSVQIQALRAQLSGSQSVPGDLGDALAVLRARAGVFGVAEQAGVMDLSLEGLDNLRDAPRAYVGDLDDLLAQVEAEREQAAGQIETLSQALLTGEGYAHLGELPEATDPLLQAAIGHVDEILDLELPYGALPDYEERPLDETIAQIDAELNRLQGELEMEQAKERELTSRRDLAWETYQTVARKLAETGVEDQISRSEVRFAIPAAEPKKPVAQGRLMNTAIAGMLGLMVGVFGAFVIEWWRQAPEAPSEKDVETQV